MTTNAESKEESVKILNSLLAHLNTVVMQNDKPIQILYTDFVSAMLTFAGMTISKSLFTNATKEIVQSDLKDIATEITIAFRQTLDRSLMIELESVKNSKQEIH